MYDLLREQRTYRAEPSRQLTAGLAPVAFQVNRALPLRVAAAGWPVNLTDTVVAAGIDMRAAAGAMKAAQATMAARAIRTVAGRDIEYV